MLLVDGGADVSLDTRVRLDALGTAEKRGYYPLKKFLTGLFAFAIVAGISLADSVSIYSENDVWEYTDGWYTSGQAIEYQSDYLWGFKIAQEIFTPENKGSRDIQWGDRPYAGYLHLDVFKNFIEGAEDDYLSLSLGVIGPASGAGTVQSGFHKITGMMLPQGWKWQLRNEPTLNIAYYKSRSVMLEKWLEFKPLAGVNFGNVLVDAELGNFIRLGYNLPPEFSPMIYNFASDTKRLKDRSFYAYAFAGVVGKAVAYDHLLQGSLFQEEYVTVTPKTFCADGFLGACVGFRRMELTFTHVEMTEQWLSQPDRDNRWDGVKLSYKF